MKSRRQMENAGEMQKTKINGKTEEETAKIKTEGRKGSLLSESHKLYYL